MLSFYFPHRLQVENQEGIVNFDDILSNSDAFTVARGDLGMEIPIEKIFYAQKVTIFKCNIQGKHVVTATQMLESMIKSPRLTRAEAINVANAVLDGTDLWYSSGETAAGAYPELAVQTMAKICLQAESYLDYEAVFKLIMSSALCSDEPVIEHYRLISSTGRQLRKGGAHFGTHEGWKHCKIGGKVQAGHADTVGCLFLSWRQITSIGFVVMRRQRGTALWLEGWSRC